MRYASGNLGQESSKERVDPPRQVRKFLDSVP